MYARIVTTAPVLFILSITWLLTDFGSHLLAAQAANDAADEAADQAAVAAIKKTGGSVRRIARNTDEREVIFQLGGKVLTDEGLAHVVGLRHVAALQLQNTKITSAGLVHLKGLTQLRRLHLEKTDVGDEGIAHLAGLVNLEYLNLYATNVTDKSLEHLKGLSKLKQLYLWQTDVTDEAVAMLEEVLPELTITRGADLDSNSSVRKRVLVDGPTLPLAGQAWKLVGVRYEGENPGPLARGNIYFRAKGAKEFSAAALERGKDGRLVGTVPAEVTGVAFQYYIRIREPKRPPATYPPTGAKAPAEVIPDAAPPALADAPQAGDVASYQVTLSWKAATDDRGIAAYRIYRSPQPANAVITESLLAKIERDQLQYSDENPPAGKTVYYAVEPIDLAGRAGKAVSIKVDVPADTPPKNDFKLTAAAGSKAVILDWAGTAERDVRQVLVFRANSDAGEAVQIAKVKLADSRRWIDKGVKDDAKYRYFIKLRDAGGLVSKPSSAVTAQAGGFLHRINCGGEEVASADGTPWTADTGRTAGTGRFTSKTMIAGTTAELQAMYQSERWSYQAVRYRFDASPGHYRATLHFAETNKGYGAVGKRTFDVLINGEKRHTAVDIFAKAGLTKAWQLQTEFQVTGNEITIELKKGAAGPAIKGLEVREISKAN